MTPDELEIIETCHSSDLAELFPQYSLTQLRNERARLKRAQNARIYRQRHYSLQSAPTGICRDYAKATEEARAGSERLLHAIIVAGVRP